MDQNLPVNVLNELFLSKTESPEEMAKMAQAGSAFIRDKIRELGFWGKFIPAKPVTVAECYVMLKSDTVYKVVHVEPGAYAMSLSFRGEPTSEFIQGRRMPVSFYKISTPDWVGYVEEIRTYPYPITKVIQDNAAKELWTIEDRTALTHCTSAVIKRHVIANANTAVALTGSALVAGTVKEDSIVKGELAREDTADTMFIHPLQKEDMTRLAKRFTAAGRSLRMKRALMTEHIFSDYSNLTSATLGETLATDVMVSGYKKDTVVGYQIVTTLKGHILFDGFIYGFTDAEFLGVNYVLDNVKFWVKREDSKITFRSHKNIGGALVNIAAVNRLELFSADATGVTGTGYDTTYPTAEENLDSVNNYVVDGYTYPTPLSLY